jgi:hypothetical protein
MKRGTLWLVAGQLVCFAAIGWLWNENRAVRQQLQAPGNAADRQRSGSGEIERAASDEAIVPSVSVPRSPRTGRSVPRPLVVVKPPRTTPVTAPEESTKEEPLSGEGMSRTTEGETGGPVNSIHPAVGTVTTDYPDSLLKNGGFEEGLEPWTCEKGKIVEDPGQERNSVLEIALDEEGFLLSQPFPWPVGKQQLTLAFRVKGAEETDKVSTAIEVRLLDKDGKARALSTSYYQPREDWAVVTVPVTRGNFAPVAIEVKGTRGKGAMWIDDVILK